uniref:Protein lin-10 n=1 Tax=Trichogramma kaykai TaxID=54128 RepID=A0ABD2VU22_9HYME
MIDLERDTSERCNRKRTNGRKKSSTLASRRQSSFGLDALTTTTAAATAAATTTMTATSNNTLTSTLTSPLTDNVSKQQQQQQQHIASNAAAVTATTTTTTSSSSSSASGRSEDVAQAQSSQMDDSGAEESPVYILTSSKGDRSYKLRDSRIIEIAGGREVFSQSRGKVAARKPRFLAASNSLNNTEGQTDNKVTLKKNNKSPNRQSVWELGSRCGEQRKQRVQREVTETVFSSEVHSVRRNPGKSILDYESPKRHASHILSYDSILNSNNVEHNVARPKSITDLEYGLPKNCLDSLNYPTSNHNTTPGRMNSRGLSLVNDGEVVVFDDIDDNWMSITATSLQQQHDEMLQSHSVSLKTRTPPSSSACSTPSPGATYHRNSTDFFKMVQPTNDCDSTNDIVSLDQQLGNHKPITMGGGSRQLIGELPIAQYTNSPRRYGVRSDSNARLPTLLASPSSTSVYVAPRPGFPQRVLPTTPSQKEPKEISEVNNGDLILENNSTLSLSPIHQNNIAASPPPIDLSSSPQLLMNSLSFTPISTSPIACVRLGTREDDEDAEAEEEEDERDVDEEEAVDADGEEEEQREQPAALERRSDSPLKSFVLPSENNLSSLESLGGSTFDYLYEFSETRKVLEEFFKCPAPSEDKDSAETFPFQDLDYELRRQGGSAYVGQRLATVPPSTEEVLVHESPKKHKIDISQAEHENNFLDLSVGTGSSGDLGETEVGLQVGHSRNFTLSPETTECDSNCGDLDSEMSLMMMDNELMPASGLLGSVNDLGNNSDSLRIYTSMPVLEDGLSSGHASDTDNNNPTVILMKRQINEIDKEITQKTRNDLLGTDTNDNSKDISLRLQNVSPELFITKKENSYDATSELQLDGLDPLVTPPPPAPQSRQSLGLMEQNNCLLMSGNGTGGGEVEAAIKDIRLTLQRTKTLPIVKSPHNEPPEPSVSPIWIPRSSLLDGRRRICNNESNSEDSTDAVRPKNDVDAELEAEEAADEEEADTDLETDRLLGQQRTDDQGFYDDKGWRKPKTRTLLPTSLSSSDRTKSKQQTSSSSAGLITNNMSVVTGVGKSTSLNSHDTLQLNASETLASCSSSPQTNKNVLSNSLTSPTSTTNNASGITTQSAIAASVVATTNAVSSAKTKNGGGGGGTGSPVGLQKSTSPSNGGAKVTGTTTTSSSSPQSKQSPTSPNSLSKETVTKVKHQKDKENKKKSRNKEGLLADPTVLIEGVLFRARYLGSTQLACEGQPTKSTRMCQAEEAVSRIKPEDEDVVASPVVAVGDGDDDDYRQLQQQASQDMTFAQVSASSEEDDCDSSEELMAAEQQKQQQQQPQQAKNQQHTLTSGSEPVVFRLQFLGSVEVDEENGGGRRRRKRLKKHMVEEAVTKIKAPDGESQPSTEVDLFISTEKIMVLNTDLKEIMMDHALRTISYIADIGDLVVLMARRRFVPHEMDEAPKNRTPKMICHVFESEEAQFIAQSIGQAFQVAYMEFLKANGIEDHSFVKEMDYQEVLNSQEIFGDELQMFAKKEMQKEVVVPKAKGEILGVVIVESGWGSMLPTVVIANLAPSGAAARCGQLNIGDQIIAINGVSLVGLPLSTCQTYIKNSKNQTVVKLTVVPCAPVVEVKIKRPDTKYQLGFSVQNGVICSLLRGGIAERGGVRVGHRIIEINNQSVVAVPHEKIVNLLATSVGEILMKTMPTSMFRLLTGQESPVYI